jgi:prepilin-type N-terminal cleavage/methylation domain-containing protein
MGKYMKGFTLAEVLITLLIIGVVASMVIPALLNDTQQSELKVGLKKAVASLNQALTVSVAQDSTDGSTITNTSNLMNIFTGKLNIVLSTTSSITTTDGTMYTFYTNGAGSGCDASLSAVSDITAAKCYVLVDVNGARKPNQMSGGGLFRDQYYLIIKSRTVIAAKNNGDAIAQQAMFQ